MTWTGLLKSLSGLLIFLALLIVGGVMGYQYVMTQMTTPPPRPVFSNDSPSAGGSAAKSSSKPSGASANSAPGVTPSATSSAMPSASPTVEASASPSPKPSDPANSYKAKVTFGDGLNVRESPSREGDRIGGVDYNEEVTVLETSSDGAWEKIRSASGVEGWVKAGYTDKLQ